MSDVRKDRLLAVADAIEAGQIGLRRIRFNMKTWGASVFPENNHGCGTAACVAGWTVGLIGHQQSNVDVESWITDTASNDYTWRMARDWLGLDDDQARSVFYPPEYTMGVINDHERYVPDALRYMAVSDEYEWYEALRVAKCAAGRFTS